MAELIFVLIGAVSALAGGGKDDYLSRKKSQRRSLERKRQILRQKQQQKQRELREREKALFLLMDVIIDTAVEEKKIAFKLTDDDAEFVRKKYRSDLLTGKVGIREFIQDKILSDKKNTVASASTDHKTTEKIPKTMYGILDKYEWREQQRGH